MKEKTTMSKKPRKDWWKNGFGPIVGQIMFDPRRDQSIREVKEILRQAKLNDKGRILDLACGTGRHSLLLAKRGFQVIGIDYSKPYLKQAKHEAYRLKLTDKINFIHADMRNLGKHVDSNQFDLVLSLYNSFGYFDQKSDDQRVLRQVYKTLKPGGAFVINTLNEGGVLKRLKTPISMGREPLRNVFMIDQAEYDRKKKKTYCSWTIIDARKNKDARRNKSNITRFRFSQNVYSHFEFKKILQQCGFFVVKTWGMLEGGKFSNSSWHQTILARKPR